MALTVDETATFPAGNLHAVIANVDFDSSYPTGGEALSATTLGFGSTVDLLLAEPQSGYIFEYDRTNSKLLAYYADYDAVADGALIQVPDTTNLSAVTNVRVFALGT